jgi:lon-related putative ATP-dependent protease
MMTDVLAQARQLEKEAKEDAKNLDRQVALFAVGHLVDQLMEKYDDLEHVTEFLKDVQEDIIENIETFKGDEQPAVQLLGAKIPVKASTAKYRVNALVAHHNSDGAPVIEERNPTYYNLFGQLEYRPQFGSMTTDFTLIKPGAFHRASGGYLILQVLDVLRNPFAWEGLKRTIRTGKVMIENMWEQYQAVPAAALRPQPIPVKVKVILVGSTTIYHLLCALDEDFKRLFKIRADFDTDMELTDNRLQEYAQFVRSRCDDGNLRPFNPAAVAGLAEHGARLAEHQGRLSTCFLAVADIVSEAAHLAAQDDADTVDAAHVRDAIQARERRSRRLQDHIQRLIDEDTLMIDTEGSVVGQVNGLSVYDLGDYRFGKPSRITCIASVGRAGVVNIERESKLSGSIHDKGVLILSGLMAARFGQNKPLSLTASLCFEQSYGGVDGDSASCAELYALLSALGDLPLRQDIAVTGSVNQRGDVQPIGGVNEKIEGFFEVCRKRGLTGSQGVMIPARNRCNLMLDAAVIEAVDKGQFAVYAVETVEQGIEILSGMPAGKPDEQGTYPEKSVFGRVDRRLRQMADILKEYVAQKENHRNEL